MKPDRLSLSLFDLASAMALLPDMADRGQFVTGLFRAMSGQILDPTWPHPAVIGYNIGIDARALAHAKSQQRSEAGLSSAKSRAAKRGTAQPTKTDSNDTSLDARSDPRSGVVREVVKKSLKKVPCSSHPPTVAEVEIYRESIGGSLLADEFVDANMARGWVHGKGIPVVDWKAHYRQWDKKRGGAAAIKGDSLPTRAARYVVYYHNTEGIAEYHDSLNAAKELYTDDQILSALQWNLKEYSSRVEVKSILDVIDRHQRELATPAAPKQAGNYDKFIAFLGQYGRKAVEDRAKCGPITDERLAKARIYGADWMDEVMEDFISGGKADPVPDYVAPWAKT